MSERKGHPSGRPIRQPKRCEWKSGPYVEHGFRNPRLNDPTVPRITQATDIHAVGFIDWDVRRAQNELEMKGRR